MVARTHLIITLSVRSLSCLGMLLCSVIVTDNFTVLPSRYFISQLSFVISYRLSAVVVGFGPSRLR
jgi:hypothetical protein